MTIKPKAMKRRISCLIFIASFLFLFAELPAQNDGAKATKRFKPYAGLTFNVHFLGYTYAGEFDDRENLMSRFPGAEFGFSVLPGREDGWSLDYRNTFLLELALYELGDALAGPGNSIFDDVVDKTVNNGILGRMDIGKTLVSSGNRNFAAGFVVSDKVMFGTDTEIPVYATPPEELVRNTGFHFTPGFFVSYDHVTGAMNVFSVTLALTQSVLNLEQFGDSYSGHYSLPLFTELDISYQMASGIYFRAGALMGASFHSLPADARIRLGLGYAFRH